MRFNPRNERAHLKKAFAYSLALHIALTAVFWAGAYFFEDSPVIKRTRTIHAALVREKIAPPNRAVQHVPAKPAPQPKASSKISAHNQKHLSSQPEKNRVFDDNAAEKSVVAPSGPSLKIDAPDFPYPEYLALIQYRIEQNWRPPRSEHVQSTTIISFRILKNGEITQVFLGRSSGVFALDQAAQRAVFSASPLPPLPAETSIKSLGVHFEFALTGQ